VGRNYSGAALRPVAILVTWHSRSGTIGIEALVRGKEGIMATMAASKNGQTRSILQDPHLGLTFYGNILTRRPRSISAILG
jgi:hypothetical protein